MRIYLLLVAIVSPSFASDTYVQGYTKKDGTYVQGHYRTQSNDTVDDNYSTRGNTNPYNGNSGTKPRSYENPYKSYFDND